MFFWLMLLKIVFQQFTVWRKNPRNFNMIFQDVVMYYFFHTYQVNDNLLCLRPLYVGLRTNFVVIFCHLFSWMLFLFSKVYKTNFKKKCKKKQSLWLPRNETWNVCALRYKIFLNQKSLIAPNEVFTSKKAYEP